jgi:hypothetical protein
VIGSYGGVYCNNTKKSTSPKTTVECWIPYPNEGTFSASRQLAMNNVLFAVKCKSVSNRFCLCVCRCFVGYVNSRFIELWNCYYYEISGIDAGVRCADHCNAPWGPSDVLINLQATAPTSGTFTKVKYV